ncbi:MAG: hypothetical protein HYW49_10070 [Deltaproteobacteria bacterium]|nr:hypothetical protein [Deltaproteobacteria bacterium]
MSAEKHHPEKLPLRLLVAVGSRRDRVCSIGAFARAEAEAMRSVFARVDVLEPDARDRYPIVDRAMCPDVIFFHAPSRHDRRRPWNVLVSAVKLRAAFPRARFVSIVHEFSEAPFHWKIRQKIILRLSNAAIVNSEADLEGVKGFAGKILRLRLGPTLFFEDLLDKPSAQKTGVRRAGARSALLSMPALQEAGLKSDEKWLLHPGLVTPGKGVDQLGKLAGILPAGTRLIVMGGKGPKKKDALFAKKAIAELRGSFGDKISFIDSPADALFASMLLAADLVVLAYDAGLSERRSSFLSAMSCGANVWTTTGRFTSPLGIDQSGAHQISSAEWIAGAPRALQSIAAALMEDEPTQLNRRVRNLRWASTRSWRARAAEIRDFLAALS